MCFAVVVIVVADYGIIVVVMVAAAAVDVVVVVLMGFPLKLLGGGARRWRARRRCRLTHRMAACEMFALHVALLQGKGKERKQSRG